MPGTKALDEFKAGTLHSGSKTGPVVRNRKQAIAIMLSEKRKAAGTPATASTRATPTFTPKLKKPKPSGLY